MLLSLSKQNSIYQQVDTYNELAWENKDIDIIKALNYANKARHISDSLNYKDGYLTSLNRIGAVYINEHRYKEASVIYKEVLLLEEEKKDTLGIARTQNNLGIIYKGLGDYNTSIKHAENSFILFETIGNEKFMAMAANNLGSSYKNLGNYKKAQEYYLKSLSIKENLGNTKDIANSHLNLGGFHEELENYELALSHLKKSETLFKNLKNNLSLSKVYNSFGIVYEAKADLDKALNYYQKSLDLKNHNNIDVLYNNMGIVYEKKNDLEKALNYYQKSLDIKKQNGLNTSAEVYNNIGNLMLRQKAYQKALDYYHKSLNEAQQNNQPTAQLPVLRNLIRTSNILKEYDKSVSYNTKYNALRDSIESSYKNAFELRVLYEEEKKRGVLLEIQQANLAKIAANNKQQRTLIIALTGGIFLLSLIYYFSKRVSKQKASIDDLIKDQEIKSINTMISTQDSERKRIAKELHDSLGIKLSVVKIHFKTVEEHLEQLDTEEINNYQMANNLLDDACEEIRKIAYDMSSGILSNFGLSQAVQDLVTSIETANQIDIEYVDHNLEDRLDSKVELNVYRIVQELVSNILRHAKATEMTLQILRNKEGIHVMTIDDGVGFNSKRVTKGMGLQNIQTRVEELEGELNIDSRKGNGTTITIQIPIDE
ncbi:sensor histidine kinase [Dokdonia sp.]|uniref:tetratricopeptide repeat-containing sensor histidine kinase n=1 Tax=Dokdonia sp. TaxID=2024995 RepID=UPI003262F988